MNKFSKVSLMSAIALTGMTMFSACASDEPGNETPNTGSNGTVKTQFAINVPKAGGNSTRQIGNVVQDGTGWTFRGIDGLRIMTTPSQLTRSASTQNFTFVQKLDGISNGNGDYTSGSKEYKVYTDVEIPVGTTHFLVYGNAPEYGNKSGKEKSMQNGDLTATFADAAGKKCSATTFKLVAVAGNEFTESQTKLVKLLNDALALAKWKGVTAESDNAMYMARESFKKLTSGSANSIRLTFEDLYNVAVQTNSDAATEVVGYIKGIYETTDTDKNDGTVTLGKLKGEAAGLDAYPTDATILMPEGAAQVTCAANGDTFSYVSNSQTVGGTNKVNVYDIVYPAALYYYANTALKATTNGEYTAWPSTATAWTNESWNGWTNRVEANTRTIALKDNINYGNALLEASFKAKGNTLDDNATGNGYQADNKISVLAEGFKVTGILVGGQPKESGWDFLPLNSTDANFAATVYDKDIAEGVVAKTDASNVNYTLLMDNTRLADNGDRATEQASVNIAVEFENNSGQTFYGVNGKIMPGAKFYLVAKLSPESKTVENVTNPSVFMRDYKTTATITIASLKNAYNTIPDLRSTKLQLGMSVDLQWQKGLVFDVNFD